MEIVRKFETERLILRPLTIDDAEAVFEWTSDPIVNMYMPYELHYDVEDAKEWIESLGDKYEFGFCLKETGEVIGAGSVTYREKSDSYEIGYNFNRMFWGMGYATEGAKALIAWANEQLGADKFMARHATANKGSANVIKKCGFQFERFGEYARYDDSEVYEATYYTLQLENASSKNEDDEVKNDDVLHSELNRQEIVLFEEMASNAHVALNVMQYDGWLLKISKGHTNRSNSVSMIYPSTIDIEEKIEFCENIYSKQNLPCVFKLTDGDEEMMKFLTEHGYIEVTPSDIMVCDTDDIAMPERDIIFYDKPVEEWLDAYFDYEGFGEKSQNIYRQMLDKICIDTKYVAIREQGVIVAVASSAMERGYMLIQNVVVHPEYRRKGYGKALCEALISKGKVAGARTAWLQVVQSNVGAHKLYENLGFQKVYAYRYLKKEV